MAIGAHGVGEGLTRSALTDGVGLITLTPGSSLASGVADVTSGEIPRPASASMRLARSAPPRRSTVPGSMLSTKPCRNGCSMSRYISAAMTRLANTAANVVPRLISTPK